MSVAGTRRLALALVATVALGGCGLLHHAAPVTAVESEWSATMAQVDREVLATRFGVADRLLSDFADRHPNTSDGYEATFWRALYKLDPSNATASPREAATLLDSYLASSLTAPHRSAATTLRRIATTLDRPAVATSGASSGTAQPSTGDKARDDELARVKDELAKANAELERIKRRVASPKP